MRYGDFNVRKITIVLLLSAIVLISVYFTSIGLQRVLGAVSVRALGTRVRSTTLAWLYQGEFNWANFVGVPRPSVSVAEAGGNETAMPVLLYHGIVSRVAGSEDVTVNEFKNQMFALKANGWQTITFDQFEKAMRGEVTLPEKSFLLTFDDGRKDSYYPVDPILQALGYHAVMFVITGHSVNPHGDYSSSYYLSKDELSIVQASGRWDLESHGYIAHVPYPINASGTAQPFYANKLWLPASQPGETEEAYQARVQGDLEQYFLHKTLWPLADGRLETNGEFESRVTQDLLTSKNLLENTFSIPVDGFAYPFNDFAQSAESDFPEGKGVLFKIVNQIYPFSFYQWSPAGSGYSQNYPGHDGQLIRRIELNPNSTPQSLLNTLAGGQPKSLPYENADQSTAGWESTWGDVKIRTDGALSVAATPQTSGGLAILDGTKLWDEYTAQAVVDWNFASNVSIIGHFNRDPDTVQRYIECSFSQGNVDLRRDDGDAVTVLAHGANAEIEPRSQNTMGISFVGGYAECLWNGGIVASAPLSAGAPREGGFGVEAWDPSLGLAQVTVRQVSVQSTE